MADLRILPGAAPIAISSIFFGAVHYRDSETTAAPAVLAIALAVNAACELAAVAIFFAFLPARCNGRRPRLGPGEARRRHARGPLVDRRGPAAGLLAVVGNSAPCQPACRLTSRADPLGRGLGNAVLSDASHRSVDRGARRVQRGGAAAPDQRRAVRQATKDARGRRSGSPPGRRGGRRSPSPRAERPPRRSRSAPAAAPRRRRGA